MRLLLVFLVSLAYLFDASVDPHLRGTGEPLDVYNPATGEHLATVDTASVEDVDKAVKAARHAFETTWGTNVPPTERGRLLNRLADLVEQNFEDIRFVSFSLPSWR